MKLWVSKALINYAIVSQQIPDEDTVYNICHFLYVLGILIKCENFNSSFKSCVLLNFLLLKLSSKTGKTGNLRFFPKMSRNGGDSTFCLVQVMKLTDWYS